MMLFLLVILFLFNPVSAANTDFTFGNAVRINNSSKATGGELHQKKKELRKKRKKVTKELRELNRSIYKAKRNIKRLERRGDDISGEELNLQSLEKRKAELKLLEKEYSKYKRDTFDYGGFGYPYFFMFR